MRSYLIRERLNRFVAAHRDRPLGILSYDVSGHDNATAVAVAHFLFGRREASRGNGASREYRYPGFIEKEGVIWLGQSVFLLTPERLGELRSFLDARGVAYGRVGVRIE